MTRDFRCVGVIFAMLYVSMGCNADPELRCGAGTEAVDGECQIVLEDMQSLSDMSRQAPALDDMEMSDDGVAFVDAMPDADMQRVRPPQLIATDLEEIDLTRTRAPSPESESLGVMPGLLFNVASDHILVGSGTECSASLTATNICQYKWLNDDSETTASLSEASPHFSDDGARDVGDYAILARDVREVCPDNPTFSGKLGLFDMDNGAMKWSTDTQHEVLHGGRGWTKSGRFTRVLYSDSDCSLVSKRTDLYLEPESASIAYSDVAVLGEMHDGRVLLRLRDEEGYKIEVDDVGVRTVLIENANLTKTYLDRRWFHAETFDVNTNQARVISFDLSTFARHDSLSFSKDMIRFRRFESRWGALAPARDAEGLTTWQIHDVTAVSPTIEVSAKTLLIVEDHAFALDNERVMVVYDLLTGQEVRRIEEVSLMERLDDERVLALQSNGDLWLCRTGQDPLLISSRVSRLYNMLFAQMYPKKAVMFETFDGGLSAWNIEAGEVGRLSERLYTGTGWCGNPEAPYSALRAKNLDWIHFSEVDPDDSTRLNVFLLPSDLSIPPRLLFNTPFEKCTEPRVSRDGSRVGWYVPEQSRANTPGNEPAEFWVTTSALR